MVRLNPAVVHVDVEDFKAALARDDLETAVGLYRGPFLDGFHLSGASREFESWVDYERSGIELELERALESLAERAEAGGDLVRAVESWRRLSRHDPANSRVALRLMRALAGAGDVANAVEFAREHESYLREELDLEPSPEIRELAERLKTAPESAVDSARLERGPAIRRLPFAHRGVRPPVERMPFGFVSRDEEIDALNDQLQAAVGGRGRVGFISGEAGTGKSVLVEEFCRRAMRARADLVVATGNGNAHTGVGDPYHVFREILGLLTGDVESPLAAGSISPDQAARLWNLLPVTATALVDEGPDLVGSFVSAPALLNRASIYGAEEHAWRARLSRLAESRGEVPETLPVQAALFGQYGRVLESVARERPVLLVLDDLQWADGGSLDLLLQLGLHVHGSRILILGLFRPSEVALGRSGGRHPLEPVINELARRYGDTEVPLAEQEDRAFVDALLDAEPNALGPDFSDTLFGLTRGHALFTVELLRSMRDGGVLVPDDAGRWTVGPTLDWSLVPARVEAVINERISRVPQPLRRVLSVGSVEGERFTLEAVADALDLPAHDLLSGVSSELEKRHYLVQAHGIHRVDGRRASVYRFRHILFQRYLYDRLDEIERSHLHERLGVALETLYGEMKDQIALSLARHFKEAGMPDKAATYLYRAGKWAVGAGANREALVHFGSAMELLMTLPVTPERDQRELDLQMALGWARNYAGAPLTDREEAFARAHELAERLGSHRQRFWALAGLYTIRGHLAGDNRQGRVLAEQCLSLARSEGDTGLLVAALDFVGRNAWVRGELRRSLTCYEELISLYDPGQHRVELVYGGLDVGSLAQGMIALALCTLGYPDQARSRSLQALALAREAEVPITQPSVLFTDIEIHVWLRDTRLAQEQCEELRRVSAELGQQGLWEPLALIHLGWCQAHQGEVEDGIKSIRKGLSDYLETGTQAGFGYFSALLAQALQIGGRADEGLRLLEDARSTTETVDELWHDSEIHWTRGELMLALDDPDPIGAEAAFRQAIEVARDQEDKSDELRATTSLARLLRSQGRTDEARVMLGEIYGWFTEGFDTADLIEAKALLAELETTN
jgi:tetratricopeptide (TPR) repeat protein